MGNAVKPLGSEIDIVPIILPLDLQTARLGDYVSLKNWQGVVFVFFKGVGTAAEDPTLTFKQATTVAGGSEKDFANVTTIFKKQGTLTGVGAWTKVTQTAAATFVGDGTSAESEGLYAIQIDAAELDQDNGFDCVTVNVADVGITAQLGCIFAILYGPRYGGAADTLPSAIAD